MFHRISISSCGWEGKTPPTNSHRLKLSLFTDPRRILNDGQYFLQLLHERHQPETFLLNLCLSQNDRQLVFPFCLLVSKQVTPHILYVSSLLLLLSLPKERRTYGGGDLQKNDSYKTFRDPEELSVVKRSMRLFFFKCVVEPGRARNRGIDGRLGKGLFGNIKKGYRDTCVRCIEYRLRRWGPLIYKTPWHIHICNMKVT
ncbi:hypothetical protein B0H63DRAFT_476240 [Podospora didyma]|uniref:Uncharacterized protein n=1 Tax=Podospora didyma TaxID=330526 RepID=A0AAE0NHH7_9PEZI|nr:hypothetical protein B0H63DRAFT_476240 [Podospora didyma]